MRALFLAATLAAIVTVGSSSPVAALDQRAQIVSLAYSVLGAPYKLGANGPTKFDCSGLVYWTFLTAGLSDRVDDGRKDTANEYFLWARRNGRLVAKPAVGDLAFGKNAWNSRMKHVGIVTSFTAKGKPRVTSALINPWGVTEVRADLMTVPIVAYAHVDLGVIPDPTPQPTATPSPTDSPSPEPTLEVTPEPSPTV